MKASQSQVEKLDAGCIERGQPSSRRIADDPARFQTDLNAVDPDCAVLAAIVCALALRTDKQRKFVSRSGQTRATTHPDVLELLVCPFGSFWSHRGSCEARSKLPTSVIERVRKFGEPEWLVDMKKLKSAFVAKGLPRDGCVDRKAVAKSVRKDGAALRELTKVKATAWTAHFPGSGDIMGEGDFARAS